ncbi:hypothetical protein NNL21_13385 [Paenibacillus mendelii]|nr:hypothetical protein [Paenibacillus mendelii]
MDRFLKRREEDLSVLAAKLRTVAQLYPAVAGETMLFVQRYEPEGRGAEPPVGSNASSGKPAICINKNKRKRMD